MTRILSTLAVATATSCLLLVNNIPAAHAEVQQVMMMYEIDPNDAHENTAQHLRIFDGNTDHRRHLSFWTSFLNHIICPHHPHDCPHGGGGGGSGGGSGGSGSGSGGSSNTGTSNTNTGSTNTNTNTNTGTSQSIYSTETGFDLYVSNGDGSYTIFDEDDYQNNQTPELWYQNQNGGGDGDDNGNGNGGGDGWTRFDLYYQNEDEEYVEYNPGNNNGGGNNNGNGDGDGGNGNGNGGDGGTPDLWYKNDEGEWTIYRTSPDYYDYDNSKVSNDCDTENDVDCVRDLKVNAMLKDLGVGMIGLGGIAVIGALVARSRRTNVNMDEHLLSGAVGKRKKTFTGLFRQKPKDFAATATTPDATHYVNAV